jgi:hypothetical protein
MPVYLPISNICRSVHRNGGTTPKHAVVSAFSFSSVLIVHMTFVFPAQRAGYKQPVRLIRGGLIRGGLIRGGLIRGRPAV